MSTATEMPKTPRFIRKFRGELVVGTQLLDVPRNITAHALKEADSDRSTAFLDQDAGLYPRDSFTSDAVPDRLYPQAFDDDSVPGTVRKCISTSCDDAQQALEDFGASDLSSMAARLGAIALVLRGAYDLIDFNDALASAVAYIRRSVLIADIENIGRPELNKLVAALKALSMNPMIDLEDASELVEGLSDAGWVGSDNAVSDLVAAFLEESDAEEIDQRTLFEGSQAQLELEE